MANKSSLSSSPNRARKKINVKMIHETIYMRIWWMKYLVCELRLANCTTEQTSSIHISYTRHATQRIECRAAECSVSTEKELYFTLGVYFSKQKYSTKKWNICITWNYHRWRFIRVVNLNSCYVLFALNCYSWRCSTNVYYTFRM